MIDNYPRLKQLMMTYINMDAEEITGEETLEGMLRYYTTRVSGRVVEELLAEISAFRRRYHEDLDAAFLRRFDYGADIADVATFFTTIVQVTTNKRPAQNDKPAAAANSQSANENAVARVLMTSVAKVGLKALIDEMASPDAVNATLKSLQGSSFTSNDAPAAKAFQRDLYHQLVQLVLSTYGPDSSEYHHALENAVKHSGYRQEKSSGAADSGSVTERLAAKH